MIDLHAHVLPGIDDGPPDLDAALALLSAMAEGGVRTVVATPHVSELYPNGPEEIRAALATVRQAVTARGLEIEVLAGAEVTIEAACALPDEELRALCLAGGPSLLVESPLSPSAGDFDPLLASLRERGFSLVLAHPERSPAFQREPRRLLDLVAAGDLCSVTAGAMSGRFGRTARRFTIDLLREGFVHDVASDAHDLAGRPPGLLAGFAALESELPGIAAHARWHTEEVPAAILAGRRPPPGPAPPGPAPPRRRWLPGLRRRR
jgi:protein-tyrosine phosphatase